MTEHKMIAEALARARADELAAVLKRVREFAKAYRDEGMRGSSYAHHRSNEAFQARLDFARAGALENLANTLEKGAHRPQRRARKPQPQEAAS